MAVEVSIYGLNNQAEDVVEGVLIWDGKAFTISPNNQKFLDRLLKIDTTTNDARTVYVSSSENPSKWISNLYRTLTGAYLRASKPRTL